MKKILPIVLLLIFSCEVERPGTEEFYKAIDINNITNFKELFKQNRRVIESHEVFFYAIKRNSIEVVEFLTAKGINRDIVDGYQNTAFLYAVMNNNIEIVKFLYKNNFEIFYNNQYNIIATQVAAENGSLEILNFLYKISSKWDDELSENTLTPFMYGVKGGSIDVVKFYLDKGDDINQLAYDNSNAIYYSLFNNDYEMTNFLIDNGVELNHMWESGATPLMFAMESQNINLVKLLLDNHVDIFPEGINLKMLISAVVNADSFEIAEVIFNGVEDSSELLEKGYRFSIINDTPNSYSYFVKRIRTLPDDFDPMYINNTINNSPKNVKAMIDMGFPVNKMIQGDPSATPLAHAASSHLIEIGRLLIEAGADVNKPDTIGQTPLMDACFKGDYKFVKLLLDNGADINKGSNSGKTPLQYAVSSENYDLVKYLLENGADPFTKNKYSETALDRAKDEIMKELLIKYMEN